MVGCSCPHDVSEHGSLVHFPTRICLVAGCDCNGTHEEVEGEAVGRIMAKQRVLHDLTDCIRATIGGDGAARWTDAVALDVATAILARFDVEAK